MSSYWSAISGTVLVLNKKEVEDFFKKYVSTTLKNGKEPNDDMRELKEMIDENGYEETPFFPFFL